MPNKASVIGLHSPVTALKGAGAKKAALLHGLGVDNIQDLLYYFPRDYEDRRNRLNIGELKAGEAAGFTGRVLALSTPPTYGAGGRRMPLVVRIGDETGAVDIVFFQAAWLNKIFAKGAEFSFFGTPEWNRGKLQLIHPDFAKAAETAQFFAIPILPVYPLKAGLSARDLRRWQDSVRPLAMAMGEYLPPATVTRHALCGAGYALTNIHFPADRAALSAAKFRLIFEEFLILQTGLLRLKRRQTEARDGIVFPEAFRPADVAPLFSWPLTGAQRRVIAQVFADMEGPQVMNRMVQGDVGCGKTAVAMAAILKAVSGGYQAVMMAPTEILAKQHYRELSARLEGLRPGEAEKDLRVAFLSAGIKATERKALLTDLEAGAVDVLIGTHAILQPDVVFRSLGLVVTDEQHRFGVGQRIRLTRKGVRPDILVMTATPIPRTLAFILYGDLDISIIDELPPGRKPVQTRIAEGRDRDRVYDFVKKEVGEGRQAYVVAPLIEDNPESERLSGVRSVESLYEELQLRLQGHRVALLHGAMKQREKDAVMEDFADGGMDVLVSTVVIEVGVNVPNATVMVVENAERFGLAQLHQLRGRVGRGQERSCCVLVTESRTEESMLRMKTMERTTDGFEIAEMDLTMRGPGELFGVRQHGLPDFRIADLARHGRILAKVREEANLLLKEDPDLKKPENRAFRERVEALFREVAEIGL